MSTEAIASNTPPLKISGLGSGLKTEEIINAIIGSERQPVVRLTEEEAIQAAQERTLRSLQGSLQQLSFSAGELSSPTLFATNQAATSSEPAKVSATVSSGAGVGGYEVNVTKLANSAQRTFTFKSPEAEDKITIDGHETTLKAGGSISELVNAINADSESTVYAAAVNSETLVLSDRETGARSEGYIAVSDTAEALTEREGTARAGQNAEYTIDGVAGTSKTNKLTEAIPGVTLTLNAVTTVSGPVTIDVSPPEPNVSKIVEQVKSFVSQYNTALESMEKETSTKPSTNIQYAAESGEGTLFGDFELTSLMGSMREAIYAPVEGLPAEMSSLASIGVNTGAPSGESHYSQSAVEGKLTIEEAKLEEAIRKDPEGVKSMLASWGTSFQKIAQCVRRTGRHDLEQSRRRRIGRHLLGRQVTAMNEMLAIRKQSLEAQYVALENVMAQMKSQSSWLAGQIASLPSMSAGSTSTSTSSGG